MIYGALMNKSQKLLLSSYPVSTPILLCSPSSSSPGTFQTKKKKKVLIYCQAHSEAFPLLLAQALLASNSGFLKEKSFQILISAAQAKALSLFPAKKHCSQAWKVGKQFWLYSLFYASLPIQLVVVLRSSGIHGNRPCCNLKIFPEIKILSLKVWLSSHVYGKQFLDPIRFVYISLPCLALNLLLSQCWTLITCDVKYSGKCNYLGKS